MSGTSPSSGGMGMPSMPSLQNRRNSAAQIIPHATGGGAGAGSYGGRRGVGGASSGSSPGAHPWASSSSSRDRYAPAHNSCRCINVTFVLHTDPPLSESEIKTVEALFGPAEGGGTGAGGGSHTSLFPEGYFVGRLQSRTLQQDSLVSSRPHSANPAWSIKRCLNCHLDVYASSRAGGSWSRLTVASARAFHGEDIRRYKEADNYSKCFGVLIRGSGHALGALDQFDAADPSALSPSHGALGPALQQLRLRLEQNLEGERVAMETRLAQQRAVEEAKLGEVEFRMRRELSILIGNVEREQESGPGAAGGAGDGISPRHMTDMFGRRGSVTTRGFQGIHKVSTEDASLPGGDDSDPRSLTPTRVMDLMASSRGISPSATTTGISHSRTSSRGSRGEPNTPPGSSGAGGLGSSASSEERSAAAAAAQHKSAASVVALPLDLHIEAPTTPLQPRGRRIVPGAAAAGAMNPVAAVKLGSSLSRNMGALPAPPVLQSAPQDKQDSVRTSHLQLDTSSSAQPSLPSIVVSASAVPGVALVPFDSTASPLLPPTNSPPTLAMTDPSQLAALAHFDDFILPASADSDEATAEDAGSSLHGQGRLGGGGGEETIFALDEEQHSPTASEPGSPHLRDHGSDGEDDDFASRTRATTGGGGTDADGSFDELSEGDEEELDEEGDDEGEAVAPMISNKAAKLLGMGAGMTVGSSTGRLSASSISSNGSTIRSRNSSASKSGTGGAGVVMVPMSLPIAIPVQLRAPTETAPDAQPPAASSRAASSTAQSGLGRSLQNRAPGVALPHQGPQFSSSRFESSDSEDEMGGGGKRSSTADGGAFVPPHTLVEEPFFSFAKVRHLASFKDPPLLGRDKDTSPKAAATNAAAPGAAGSASSATPIQTTPLNALASPAPFQVPLSSSVPRVVGSLGMRQMAPAPAPAAASSSGGGPPQHSPPPPQSAQSGGPLISKLGFSAVTVPPQKTGTATRGLPSSRNPTQQQQPQQR